MVVASHVRGRVPDARCRVIDAHQAPPSEPPEWTKLLDPGESGGRQRAFVRRFGNGVGPTPRSLSTLMELHELIDSLVPAE